MSDTEDDAPYEFVDDDADEADDSDAGSDGTTAVPAVQSLTAADCSTQQARAVERVRELGPSRGDALLLLRHFKWDVAALEEAFVADAERVSRAARLASTGAATAVAPPAPGATFECAICFDDTTEHYAMQCGHRFCRSCWVQHLTVSIETPDDSCLDTRCPAYQVSPACRRGPFFFSATPLTFRPQCGLAVSADDVQHVLGLESSGCRQYSAALVRSFVDDSPRRKPCPGRDCDHVVEVAAGTATEGVPYTLSCGQGHRWCWTCHADKGHMPADCQFLEPWDRSVKHQSGSIGGKAAKNLNIRNCPNPKCKVITEKESGCNYLRCSRCTCNWCWQCGDWGGGTSGRELPHHVYVEEVSYY